MDVASNGTTLYAEDSGVGPTLVFVHGMCGDARTWSGQVERLRDRFRCVTYDRRGHTRSPRTDVPETVELHADDLAGLVRALDLGPCVLVGSSGGARVVVDTIRRHPDVARGAVISEPPIGALAPDLFKAMLGQIAPRVQAAADAGGPRAAVDAFFEVMCPGLWNSIDEDTRDHFRDNAAALFPDLTMPPYQIDAAAAGSILTPALVIGGTQSFLALHEGARTLAAWLPHATFEEYDCGHVTYAERPDRFAASVAAFAGSLS